MTCLGEGECCEPERGWEGEGAGKATGSARADEDRVPESREDAAAVEAPHDGPCWVRVRKAHLLEGLVACDLGHEP